MTKVASSQRRQTEKAIIDALLTISEIVQKTEVHRQREQSASTDQPSRKVTGDGDFNISNEDEQVQQVPVPPPMRTLDSYVSGFNQQPLQRPSNCNQASCSRSKQYVINPSWNSPSYKKPSDQSSGKEYLDCRNHPCSHKRHYYESSSTSLSSNDQRKKSFKQQSDHRLFQTDTNVLSTSEPSDKVITPPKRAAFNSTASNLLDGPRSSLVMLPIASTSPVSPATTTGKQELPNPSTDSKADLNTFIDQHLQATLEKHLKNPSPSSTTTNHVRLRKQRTSRLPTLTRSETGKLINDFDLTKQVGNVEHYEKQRELAMLAAKQGNYSLSYSIYTDLFHDNQYDYKFKSEILASRATTLLLEQKCFESIDDCTQAVAYNQWNKLAYVVRAACWMIKQEYAKALEDYSKLFHFFDQSEHVLDLLNLAYEKFKKSKDDVDEESSIKIEQDKERISKTNLDSTKPISSSSIGISINPHPSLSPTTSLTQPAVYLCYPCQAYPTWINPNDQEQLKHAHEDLLQSIYTTEPFHTITDGKHRSSQSVHSNNNAVLLTMDSISSIDRQSFSSKPKSSSNLIWIQNPSRSF